MKGLFYIIKSVIVIFILLSSTDVCAQFYNGNTQEFGKSRVQYQEFDWTYFKFNKYKVYSYTGGAELADYTSKNVERLIKEVESDFDYIIEEPINFIVYNKISHYRQSNIGIDNYNDADGSGVAKIDGTKVFLYNEGDKRKLDSQIKEGITRIIINKMTYGSSWKDVMKNSALLSLPNWYLEGLVNYIKYKDDPSIDNKIKDLVLEGKLEHFNHLEGDEAVLAGHIVWRYIHEKFGFKVIPNILYMSRISRNMDNGFLYVLGVSLKSLVRNTSIHFTGKYEGYEFNKTNPEEEGEAITIKKVKNAAHYNFKMSPDGRYVSYVTNKQGKYNLWLSDIEQNSTKKIATGGFKYEWITDHSYPITNWHPSSDMLVFIDEKEAEPRFNTYILEDRKVVSKGLYKVEKVLDMSFDSKGKMMLFSAIQNGSTDIYEYSVRSNSIAQLTDDSYDDMNPSYVNGTEEFIFTSNRTHDTLLVDDLKRGSSFDLFVFQKGNALLKRITNSDNIDELSPKILANNHFSYWAFNDGVSNLYNVTFDSTISHIDTTVHYRYTTQIAQTTNYKKSLLEYDVSSKINKQLELFYFDNEYKVFIKNTPGALTKEVAEQVEELDNKIERKKSSSNTTYKIVPNIDHDKVKEIDTDNYQFVSITNDKSAIKKQKKEKEIEHQEEQGQEQDENQVVTAALDSTEIIVQEVAFLMPNQLSYHTSFAASDVQTNFDFNFNNNNYQRYAGITNYVNPGMGVELKVELKELFEDYKVDAGARFSLNFNYKDYFLTFANRTKRLDKKYTVERQSLQVPTLSGGVQKIYTNQAKYELNYPFSEVFSLKGTANIRMDKNIIMGLERNALDVPTTTNTLGSFKLELVFDNSIQKGLNLYNGARGKIFAETYNSILATTGDKYLLTLNEKIDIVILGLDYRKYIKIHRNIIWANRIAASTSFGEYKLLYYLGGVDNQVSIANRETKGFDDTVPVGDDNYLFQARATNMRGFVQNSRNGNNFVIINSELRIPIFQYLSQKTIKSDFIKHFQLVPFADIGSAWSGRSPNSDSNSFRKTYITDGAITVVLENQKQPVIASFGLGLRTRMWGYFVKLDYAAPLEDASLNGGKLFLSVGYDF